MADIILKRTMSKYKNIEDSEQSDQSIPVKSTNPVQPNITPIIEQNPQNHNIHNHHNAFDNSGNDCAAIEVDSFTDRNSPLPDLIIEEDDSIIDEKACRVTKNLLVSMPVTVYVLNREAKYTLEAKQSPLVIFESIQREEGISDINRIELFDSDNRKIDRNIPCNRQNIQGSLFVTYDITASSQNICINIQCANRRAKASFNVSMDEKLLGVFKKYAVEKQGKRLDQVRFLFDGDLLNGSETACSLDLEGGETIDMEECESGKGICPPPAAASTFSNRLLSVADQDDDCILID